MGYNGALPQLFHDLLPQVATGANDEKCFLHDLTGKMASYQGCCQRADYCIMGRLKTIVER